MWPFIKTPCLFCNVGEGGGDILAEDVLGAEWDISGTEDDKAGVEHGAFGSGFSLRTVKTESSVDDDGVPVLVRVSPPEGAQRCEEAIDTAKLNREFVHFLS